MMVVFGYLFRNVNNQEVWENILTLSPAFLDGVTKFEILYTGGELHQLQRIRE